MASFIKRVRNWLHYACAYVKNMFCRFVPLFAHTKVSQENSRDDAAFNIFKIRFSTVVKRDVFVECYRSKLFIQHFDIFRKTIFKLEHFQINVQLNVHIIRSSCPSIALVDSNIFIFFLNCLFFTPFLKGFLWFVFFKFVFENVFRKIQNRHLSTAVDARLG